MKTRTSLVSLLLFGSGACALIYQTVWLREFRLIFGGSTAASAAVLAVFMGGLGLGGIILGKRVDASERPLRFYAILEVLIALTAALSLPFLWLVRAAYLAVGGQETLGYLPATIFRLALAAVVLAIPTFLMGGTLPAAARAAETEADSGRGKLAFVYGMNTLGAVLGVLVSTFYLLEKLGNRTALFIACAVNIGVALAAFGVARFMSATPTPTTTHERTASSPERGVHSAPLPLVLVAAGVAGFVFLLMELVWYRMLTPLLGGTTFTFGLILAVALLGIGVGGAAYSWAGRFVRPTLAGFALSCGIEAVLLALPFALGDRLAVFALLMRSFQAVGFQGDLLAWSQLTMLVVFPAAVISGFQFPLLIALLGKGSEKVGAHTGLAYACNTLGAIIGSLAGGFGLLPALSATGAWKFAIVVLALLGATCWAFSFRAERRLRPLLAPAGVLVASIVLLLAPGPTAAWRQSAIGAGRANDRAVTSIQRKEEWLRLSRRYMLFERDGVESSLGVSTRRSITFLINGKSDGNAWGDAGTQIMSGLIGAILQPNATRALVVGLGTGSTAGWLGDIPAMERVDVVELEGAVLKVAELCAPVNQNVLSNPKVRTTIGDARETLLTTRDSYDLIVSEPSNPYRAGVASLYTQQYYAAAAQRLRPGGLFLQFVQAYEVDSATIRSIYATFGSVFPVVETWQTNESDLLFIGSKEPIPYDVEALRRRIAEEPFKTAIAKVWRVTDLEGVLAHFVANASYAKQLTAEQGGTVNTDDRNTIEFSFARTVGKAAGFSISDLREAAHRRDQHRPTSAGYVDWARVVEQNLVMDIHLGTARPPAYSFLDANQRRRLSALSAYSLGSTIEALRLWREQSRDAENLTENAMLSHMLAWAGDSAALDYSERVREVNPGEASMLVAFLRARQGRFTEAREALETAFVSLRTDPWIMATIAKGSFDIAQYLATQDATGATAARLFEILDVPFSVHAFDEDRRKTLNLIAFFADGRKPGEYTRRSIASFEPNVPWDRQFLQMRRDCYRALGDPRLAAAEKDLAKFLAAEPQPFDPAIKQARPSPTEAPAD